MGARNCHHTHGVGECYNGDVQHQSTDTGEQYSVYKHHQPSAWVVCATAAPRGMEERGSDKLLCPVS